MWVFLFFFPLSSQSKEGFPKRLQLSGVTDVFGLYLSVYKTVSGLFGVFTRQTGFQSRLGGKAGSGFVCPFGTFSAVRIGGRRKL